MLLEYKVKSMERWSQVTWAEDVEEERAGLGRDLSFV